MYTINQNGYFCDSRDQLQDAFLLAQTLFDELDAGTHLTVTVEHKDNMIASLSSHRIIGTFTKQNWTGRKNDYAETVAEVEFDATDYVLLMHHADLVELEDHSEESDTIGDAHISWNGPREVVLTASICAYFGVTDVEEITVENFTFVKNHINPQPAMEVDVELLVKMKVRVAPGGNIDNFLTTMEHSFVSTTAGITITSTDVSEHLSNGS